jgi:hypothetical protein
VIDTVDRKGLELRLPREMVIPLTVCSDLSFALCSHCVIDTVDRNGLELRLPMVTAIPLIVSSDQSFALCSRSVIDTVDRKGLELRLPVLLVIGPENLNHYTGLLNFHCLAYRVLVTYLKSF